jgi:multiple sugar transport system substrate-binding protein
MRRPILTAAALGASIVLLASCSSGGGTTGGDADADTDLTAEISYGYWDANQQPAMEQLIADFNEQYPNITITSQVTPYNNYFTKLQTQGSSKTLPDVFWMNGPNFPLYADAGLLQPVYDDFDPSNYPDALNELYSYDGTQFGAPKDFDTVAVYYNKALFDQAGVEHPSDDWDWDEFHEKAKAISDALSDEGVYGAVAGLTGGQEMYYNTILQAGGSIISEDGATSGYDDPKSIEGLQFVADLIADGSMPTLAQMSDTPQDQWFVNGKAAMFWSGTWSNAQLLDSPVVDDIEVAPLPAGEQQATVIHGLANVVAKDSPHLEAALAFQKFLASEEAAKTQAEMGAANPAFNGTQTAFIESAPYDLQVFLDEADEYSYPYPVSTHTAVWNTFENELLPQAFSGEKPVADVAAELAEKMNAALADE